MNILHQHLGLSIPETGKTINERAGDRLAREWGRNKLETYFEVRGLNSIPIKPLSREKRKSEKEICDFAQIKCLSDLERVSSEVIWQNFERLTAYIFEQNDFSVEINSVKTQKRKRRQYDVIARSTDRTLLVECKKWGSHRPRLSALKNAIRQHKERCEFYWAVTRIEALPIVVTLVEEKIKSYEGVPIVPILKLNSFIGEMSPDFYLDQGLEGQEYIDQFS